MSKIIDTSFAASGQYFTAPTELDHLQQSYAEGLQALAIRILGSSTYSNTALYRLWGCTVLDISIVPPNRQFSITQGAVFYNGEIYIVDAATFSYRPGTTGVDTAIVTTYADASGTNFADGSNHQICEIRKIVFSAKGTPTPSGDGGLTTSFSSPVLPADSPSYTSTGITLGSGWSNVGTPFYNLGYKIDGNTACLCGAITATLVSGGNITVATLPSLCYPSQQIITNAIGVYNGSPMSNIMGIDTAGNVSVLGMSAGSYVIYFDNFQYRLS